MTPTAPQGPTLGEVRERIARAITEHDGADLLGATRMTIGGGFHALHNPDDELEWVRVRDLRALLAATEPMQPDDDESDGYMVVRPLGLAADITPRVVWVTPEERAYMAAYSSLSPKVRQELREYATKLGLSIAPESAALLRAASPTTTENAPCSECGGTGSVDNGAYVVDGEICAGSAPCPYCASPTDKEG